MNDSFQITTSDQENARKFEIIWQKQSVAFAIVIPKTGMGMPLLSDIFVAPAFRGKKLTSMLMKKIFEEFPGKMYLQVASHYDAPKNNNQLRKIYSRYGFKDMPSKKGYMIKEGSLFEQAWTEVMKECQSCQ